MFCQEIQTAVLLVSEKDDEASFEKLFKHFYPNLLSFAESFLKNRFLAEEVVEDVFIKLWANRKVLSAIKNLTYYLYVAVKHETINCLTKQKRLAMLSLDEVEVEPLHFHKTPESILISAEITKEIEGAINDLPPRCQLIFRLVKEDGLKYREAADLLNVSVKTVETQISLALSKITEVISAKLPHTATDNFSGYLKTAR